MNYPSAVQLTMNLESFKRNTAKEPPNYRRSDPETPKSAGKSAKIRAGTQRHALLLAYLIESELEEFPTRGLTDEEAGNISRLSLKPKCCYWKRCSELREMGLIAPNGEQRHSSANEKQMVCIITSKGIRCIKEAN